MIKTVDGYRYEDGPLRPAPPLTHMSPEGTKPPLLDSIDELRERIAAAERAIEELRRLAGWVRE